MKVKVRERGTDKFIMHKDFTLADVERYNKCNGRLYIEIPKGSLEKPVRRFNWRLAVCLFTAITIISSAAAYRWGWEEIPETIFEIADGKVTLHTEYHWRFLSYRFDAHRQEVPEQRLRVDLVQRLGEGKFRLQGNVFIEAGESFNPQQEMVSDN